MRLIKLTDDGTVLANPETKYPWLKQFPSVKEIQRIGRLPGFSDGLTVLELGKIAKYTGKKIFIKSNSTSVAFELEHLTIKPNEIIGDDGWGKNIYIGTKVNLRRRGYIPRNTAIHSKKLHVAAWCGGKRSWWVRKANIKNQMEIDKEKADRHEKIKALAELYGETVELNSGYYYCDIVHWEKFFELKKAIKDGKLNSAEKLKAVFTYEMVRDEYVEGYEEALGIVGFKRLLMNKLLDDMRPKHALAITYYLETNVDFLRDAAMKCLKDSGIDMHEIMNLV